MALTTFKYADQDDLRKIFPQAGQYHNKTRIIDFADQGSNIWIAYPGISFVTDVPVLYFDGAEGTKVSGTPNGAKQWDYTTGTDLLEIYTTTDPNDTRIIEIGDDKDTFFNQILTDASMELSSLLDARFPRPIQPSVQQSIAGTTPTAEYDYLIVRMTCLLVAKNLLIMNGDHEEAEKYYNEIYNAEDTGLVNRLNAGEIKLSFEIDYTDKTGDINEVTRAGTMYLTETYGEYTGNLYDRIQCICTTAGAYGTAEISIKTLGSDNLFQNETTGIQITGGLQPLIGGLYGRWEGSSMSENDRWDVEVRNAGLRLSNQPIKGVQMTR